MQGFSSKGITPYAITIQVSVIPRSFREVTLYRLSPQNEPENSNDSYPSCKISAVQEAQIATTLRSLLDKNGFSAVKIIGFDHNWDGAGSYAVQVVSVDICFYM